MGSRIRVRNLERGINGKLFGFGYCKFFSYVFLRGLVIGASYLLEGGNI